MTAARVFTIGFTRKPAAKFFDLMETAGVRRVIDVRLNNVSQLAGFTKRDDLEFFLRRIGKIDYVHRPELAPTKEILDEYKKNKGPWSEYERRFLALMHERRIEHTLPRELFDGGCLLCSEHEPHNCHRRLVAEYLREKWGAMDIVHLVE